MTFYEKLRSIQKEQESLLCIGLDTDLTKIPEFLFDKGDAVLRFNRQIIESTHDLVCAYKINLAFYEALGEQGWQTLHQTLASIPTEIVTIGDAKRGDIGNTAEMYASSLRVDFGFDASTVNPYMGSDSVEPFLRDTSHGAFVLALTSNPGAKDFQYAKINGRPLYEHVIRKVKKWNASENCGLVVGATRPVELKGIRKLAPTMPILIPGVGTQGGSLESAVRYGADKHGEFALINASRSILYCSRDEDFGEAARNAALQMRDDINKYRSKYFSRS